MKATITSKCPAWCTDHEGTADGSGDTWHKSRDVEVSGTVFYASTGTLTGEVEIFSDRRLDELTLDEAEAVAAALLQSVQEARA